jgi:very-short-patch-repair endonuclease
VVEDILVTLTKKMTQIHNKRILKSFRKSLRNQSTAAESTLWKILKSRKTGNLKFRRQHSVGNYILDFYCPEVKLAIELDGEIHTNPAVVTYDIERDEFLKKLSIHVLRYENRWVYEYPDEIIKDIMEFKEKKRENEPPPSNP